MLVINTESGGTMRLSHQDDWWWPWTVARLHYSLLKHLFHFLVALFLHGLREAKGWFAYRLWGPSVDMMLHKASTPQMAFRSGESWNSCKRSTNLFFWCSVRLGWARCSSGSKCSGNSLPGASSPPVFISNCQAGSCNCQKFTLGTVNKHFWNARQRLEWPRGRLPDVNKEHVGVLPLTFTSFPVGLKDAFPSHTQSFEVDAVSFCCSCFFGGFWLITFL